MLLADDAAGNLPTPAQPELDAVIGFLEGKGIEYTTWEGWHKLDAVERERGEAEGRERKKVVEWEEMVRHSRS